MTVKGQLIESSLNKIASEHLPERAYLHYDKAQYFAGETIWFKAYLMEGFFPAELSKTFYIDWIGENGELLSHNASPMIGGLSNGQFEIPSSYSGNVIHVRGYTKWMLNFDSSVIYSKSIRIIPKTITKKQSAPDIKTSIGFFPEGGELVVNIPNTVAFKANDQWGRPVAVRGVILENAIVKDSVKSVHNGMGSFVLVPKTGVKYSFRWKDDNGKTGTTILPAAKSSGISMQVISENKRKQILVNFSQEINDDISIVNIIGNMHGQMIFKTAGNAVPGGSIRKIIPVEKVPSGILTITVFDRNWNAIAERICFVNNLDHSFTTGFEVKHWGLNKRARNEIELTLPANISVSNLSISVTDAMVESDSSEHIASGLLLSSELKGYIHNPSYYFTDTTVERTKHLDLVMLTHGWRRFKWEDLNKGNIPETKFERDTGYLTLSGQLVGVPKSLLSGTESLVLFVKEQDSGAKMLMLPIDKNGNFNDPDIIFFDTLKVYYSVKSKKFSSPGVNFMTNKLSAPNYTRFKSAFSQYYPVNFDTSSGYQKKFALESLSLQEQMRANVMETVTVTARAKSVIEEMDDKYSSGMFKTSDSYKFDLVNDPLARGGLDVFTYLTGRVPGLQIIAGTTPQLSWRGSTPQLFLDERPADADLLMMVPMDDIAYVKVMRPPFIGAVGGGGGGAIVVYTKKGNDRVESNTGRGLSNNTLTGYAPIREFYSPNYAGFDKRHELKDVRTTLYWNPMVIVKPGQPVKIQFYNNDISKSFRVIVQGMSSEGLLTHFEQLME